MKTYSVCLIFAITLLVACNQPVAQPTESPKSEEDTKQSSRENKELNISDFAPCKVCESEGKLVNPLPEDWSVAEKELYKVVIEFWEETTGFLFTSEMIDLYKSAGPAACRDYFVQVISGELKGNGSTMASEDPIRAYGWRNRYQESVIWQMEASDPCEVQEVEPAPGSEAYDKWQKEVFKCIDIVFDAGEPVCFYVERPIIYASSPSIVRFRIYDAVDSKGVPHLVSAYCFYFEKVDGEWHLAMRRDR